MTRAKTEGIDPGLVRTSELAKALAHPVRLRILELLADRRACICGCLVDLLPVAQSTVSQHLKELREAGLIRGEVDGPRTCYCLDTSAVAEAWAAFKSLFGRLGEGLKAQADPPQRVNLCREGRKTAAEKNQGGKP